MVAIISIESQDYKHCSGPHLAFRSEAQKVCKKGTAGFRRGPFVPLGQDTLGFERETFA